MDGKTILDTCRSYAATTATIWDESELTYMINTAFAAEREAIAALVWEHRGTCVSDESALALMGYIRERGET